MKQLLLILSFLISCLFSGGDVADSGQRGGVGKSAEIASAVVGTTAQDQAERNRDYNSQAILPSQEARVSGEKTSVSPTVRSNSSGRRTQVSQKHPFRIIKAGKVIDRNNFQIFQEELHQFQTGIHSISRYIYSIRHLLI